MLTRRDWLAASGSFIGALVARGSAFAQDYPSKPVRVIVPYAAGGATDTLARLLATRIDQELKQSVVIDNRGGGASQVGTQAIATAPPDGYTIGMIDSAFTINPGLFAGKLPYDTRKDFAPISLIATAPLVFVVHPSVAGQSAQELVALAKQKPGMTYALPGLGTPVHLAGEQLRQATGIDVVVGAVSRRRALDCGFHRRPGADDIRDRAVDPRARARRPRPRARDGRRALAAAARMSRRWRRPGINGSTPP